MAAFLKNVEAFQPKRRRVFKKRLKHLQEKHISNRINLFKQISANLVYKINLITCANTKVGRNASYTNFPLFKAIGGL